MATDKRSVLYKNLINSGRVDSTQIGNIDEFLSAVKDEQSARKFHSNLRSVFGEDEIGDEDMFYNSISSDFDVSNSANSANSGVTDGSNVANGADVMPQQQRRAGLREQVAEAKNSDALVMPKNWDVNTATDHTQGMLTADKTAQALAGMRDSGELDVLYNKEEEDRIDREFTSKPAYTPNDVYNNYGQRFALTERGKVLGKELEDIQHKAQQELWNEWQNSDEYKQVLADYRHQAQGKSQKEVDEIANRMNDDLVNRFNLQYGDRYQEAVKPYQDVYNKELAQRYGNNINQEVTALDKAAQGDIVQDMTANVDRQLVRAKQGRDSQFYGPYLSAARGRSAMTDEERTLFAAKRQLEASEEIINAVKNDSGFVKGFVDNFDWENFTFGMTDMEDMQALNKALKKSDAGENLTEAEQSLLDAALTNMIVQGYYASDLNTSYDTMGKGLAESAPFMLEFIANPISSAGSASAKSMLKYGMKKYGLSLAKKNMRNRAIKTGAKMVEGASKLGLDKALGMTATSSLGRVAAGTYERMNENYDIKTDGYGAYAEKNDSDMGVGEAIARGAASTFFENQSEMIFRAFGGASELIKNVVPKSLAGGATELASRLGRTKIGSLYNQIHNSPWGQRMKVVKKRAAVGDIGEEYLEEVYNNFANVAMGEMSTEDALSLENNIDTFLGLVPTQVMFSALGVGGFVRDRYKNKKAIARYMTALGEKRAQEVQNAVIAYRSDETKLTEYLSGIVLDNKIGEEERKNIFGLAKELVEKDALDGIEEARATEQQTPQEAATERGYNAETPQEKHGLALQYEQMQAWYELLKDEDGQLASILDMEDRAAALQALNEQGYSDRVNEAFNYWDVTDAFNGMIEGMEDRVATAVADANKLASTRAHVNGTIIEATTGDRQNVWIKGGQIALNEDGTINMAESDKTLFVITENGERKMMSPTHLTSAAQKGTLQDAINYNNTTLREQLELQEGESADLNPNTPQIVPNMQVNVGGVPMMVAGLENGNAILVNPQDTKSQPMVMPVGQLRQTISDELDAQESGNSLDGGNNKKRQKTEEGIVREMVERLKPENRNAYIDARIKNLTIRKKIIEKQKRKAENKADVNDVVAWEAQQEQVNKINAEEDARVKNALKAIDNEISLLKSLRDNNMSADAAQNENTSIEQIEQNVSEGVDNGSNMAETPATAQTETPAVAETETSAVTETPKTEEEIKAENKKKLATITQMEDADARKLLYDYYGEQMKHKATVNREAADKKLEAAQQAVEKAQQKFDDAPIEEEDKAEVALAKAKDALAEAQRVAGFWRRIDDGFKGVSNEVQQPQMDASINEPQTAEERAAEAIGNGEVKLLQDSFKRETGYSNSEARGFIGIFASKEKGGKTIEEAAEYLVAQDARGLFGGDVQVARNAILEVLAQTKKKSELKNYIANNRQASAEADMQAEREAQEDWYMQNYGMSVEEYEGYEDSVHQIIREKALTEEEYAEYVSTFADETLNNKENGLESNEQSGTDELREGSGTVLSEEQPVQTERTGDVEERPIETDGGINIEDGTSQGEDAAGNEVKGSNETVSEGDVERESSDVLGRIEDIAKEEERRKPLRARAREWEEKLGVKVRLMEDVADVTNASARRAILSGRKVTGWYDDATGEVCLYMPYLKNAKEVDLTYLHEVVAHKGLRQLLGEAGFNELCDKVYEMMSPEERHKMLGYSGVANIADETARKRAAADEYMAHLAEETEMNPSVWDEIVEFVKRILWKLIGKKYNKVDVAEIIRESYINLRDNANSSDYRGGENGTRFRFSRTPEEFEATQKEAVEKKGIVVDGLNEAVLDIVNVPRHDFTGRGIDAIHKAEKWANENIVGEHVYHKGLEDEFTYLIDDDAIGKFLSKSSTTESDNLGVHLAVLKKLPEVIDNSIEAEIHPDYKKVNKNRSVENGVDKDNLLVHRLYGAVDIDGKIYRAKTTIHEFKDKENKAYDYKITEVELIVSGSSTSNARTNSTSISAAKVLENVEKSYDKGKKLLDESKKTRFRFVDGMTNDEIYDGLNRLSGYSNGAYNLMNALEEYYGGRIVSASSGTRHAIENGLVPVPKGQYEGANEEYHHLEFEGENGETFVKAVPFVESEGVEENEGVRFRVTKEQDAEYLDAVNKGDLGKAQKMVKQAAKMAMPNTKVVDTDGNPKIVYHGTSNGRFNVFDKERVGEKWNADEVGFFFTDSEVIGKEYTSPYPRSKGNPHLFNVYLNIEKPLLINGLWYRKNYGRSISKYDAIEVWDNNQYDILEAFNKGDFDGIIIDTTGMGMRQPMMMVAFEPNQIKSAETITYDDNGNVIPLSKRFDKKNDDIRFRSVESETIVDVPQSKVLYTAENIGDKLYKVSGKYMKELYKENGELGHVLTEIEKAKREYERVKPIFDEYRKELIEMKGRSTEAAQEVVNELIADVEYSVQFYKDLSEGKDSWRTGNMPRFREVNSLVAVHNISEDNLRKVLRVGGLIMPSIAITKANMGHEDFGTISLLFDKSTIDPSDRRNKVYGGDAWTPRFPQISAKLSEKVVSSIGRKIRGLLDDKTRELYSLSAELYPDNIERTISNNGVEGYYGKEYMKIAYLLDQGKRFKLPMKMKDYGDMAETVINMAKERGLKVSDIQNGGLQFYDNNQDFVQAVNDARVNKWLESLPAEKRNDASASLLKHSMTFARFDTWVSQAARMEYDLAHGGLQQIVDKAALTEYINKKVKTNNADYNKWVDDLFDGIIEKYGIRNNKDWYTPSGNSRPWEQLYDAATPANILKHMLAENEQGGSGSFFDSNIMGASAESYESIDEIREKGKKRLQKVDNETYSEWSSSVADRMSEICDEFLTKSQKNDFGSSIDAKIAITNAVAKDKTANGIYKEMKKDYPRFTMEQAKRVEAIVKEIQDSAIGYFEAKPQRIVPLSEVRKAIVPSNTSEDVLDGLKEHGIDVAVYRKGNEKSRNRLIKKESEGIRFREANENQEIFVSNAEKAVKNIKQEKGTPQQWLAMIEKNGGLKAGEDKWLGLSDWLKGSEAKTITKDEILDFIGENKIRIEEVKYGEGLSEFSNERLDALNDEFQELISEGEEATDSYYTSDWVNYAWDAMVERYGDDFESAFEIEGQGTASSLVPTLNYYDEISDAAKYFLGIEDSTEKPINSTRLQYTTEGLENKREIALTVPTIEPWNESDEIHFGDAGEGRAVAWIRFGETDIYESIDDVQEVTEFHEPYKNVNGRDVYRPVGSFKNGDYVVYGKGRDGNMIYVAYINDKQLPVAHETLEDSRNAMNAYYKEHPRKLRKPLKVLVIDEIQSKRHQEGREKGYDIITPEERSELRVLTFNRNNSNEYRRAVNEAADVLSAKDLLKEQEAHEKYFYEDAWMPLNGKADEFEAKYGKEAADILKEAANVIIEREKRIAELEKKEGKIPNAPFEKNWHELAMKRMLRLAAEEGFDKVAWTTGEQQAERYDLGGYVNAIKVAKYPRGIEVTSLGEGNNIVHSDVFADESAIADVYGKEMASKIVESAESLQPSKTATLSGENLRIGGEGMKGFYDKMLPSFVQKYVKKWGAKVGEVELPELEESARKMWSVDVTPEMKESVMEGQVMFREITDPAIQSEVDKFKSRYNSAEVEELPSEHDEVVESILEDGYSLEEAEKMYDKLKETKSIYDPIEDKIYIFAGKVSTKEVEEALLHENVHRSILAILSEEERRELADTLYELHPKLGEKIKNSPNYDENAFDEEMIAYSLQFGHRNGMENYLGDLVSDKRIQNILNYINYDGRGEYSTSSETIEENADNNQANRAGKTDSRGKNSRRNLGVDSRENQVPQSNDEGHPRREHLILDEVVALESELGRSVNVIDEFDALPEGKAKEAIKAGRKVLGWYQDGQVYVYLPNARSASDVRATVYHEVVGHLGLRELLGERFGEFLNGVYMNVPQEVRDEINRRASKNGWDFHEATEEYMAELAERYSRGEQVSGWKKLLYAIRDAVVKALNRLGMNVGFKMSDNYLMYVLWRSRQRLQPSDVMGRIADRYMRNVFNVDGDVIVPSTKNGLNGFDKGVRFREIEEDAKTKLTRMFYEQQMKSFGYRVREGFQDSMLALKKLQEAIAKATNHKVEEWEDAYIEENHLSSRNTADFDLLTRNLYKPMMRIIHEMMKKGNMQYQDVLNYLNAKHGIERNRDWAVRDELNALRKIAKDDAQQLALIDQMEQNYYAYRDTMYQELENGNIDFDEYCDKMDDKAREYAPSYNGREDYSGLSDLFGHEGDVADEWYVRARDMISNVESAMPVTVDKLWSAVRSTNQYSLDKAKDSGTMSVDAYDKISNQFKWYVPLRGFNEQTAEDVYDYFSEQSATGAYQSTVKKGLGRKSQAGDIVATMFNMAQSAIMHGNKNVMKQKFLNLVMNSKTGIVTVLDNWYVNVGTPTDPVWEAAYPDFTNKTTPEEIAQAIKDFEDDMKVKAAQGVARKEKGHEKLPYRPTKAQQIDEHMVIVKRNGKEFRLILNANPRAAQALNGMTNPSVEAGAFEKFAQRINPVLASLYTTKNPTFIARNLIRDTLMSGSSIAIKESFWYNKRFVGNQARSLANIGKLIKKYEAGTLDVNVPMERYFKEFVENGAETGYSQLWSIDEFKKNIENDLKRMEGGLQNGALNTGEALLRGLEFANRCAEDMNRFAVYMTSRESGRSIQRSVHDAKEVSVNFNKKGAGAKTGGWVGALAQFGRTFYLFFNAAIQGLKNYAKLAKEHPMKFTGVVGMYAAWGAVMPLINELIASMSGDDDEDVYGNLPEWVRRNNMCLYLPFANTVVTVPLPIELRAIYGLGEATMQIITGKENKEEAFISVANLFMEMMPINPLSSGIEKASLESLLMSLAPTLAQPMVQHAQNKSWTGSPLYRETPFNEEYPEYTKAYKGTPKTLVEISKFLNELTGGDAVKAGWANINPAIVDNYISGYLGGVGTTIMDIEKTVEMFMDEPFDLRNIPVVKAVVQTPTERNKYTRSNSKYFELLDELKEFERLERGYEKLVKQGGDDAAKYMELYKKLQSEDAMRMMEFKSYNNYVDYLREIVSMLPNGEEKDKMETELNVARKLGVEKFGE